jgi:hypothetical protein
LLFVLLVTVLVGVVLRLEGEYDQWSPSLSDATFEVVSVVTSTGFGIVDFSHWPDFLAVETIGTAILQTVAFALLRVALAAGCRGSRCAPCSWLQVCALLSLSISTSRRCG